MAMHATVVGAGLQVMCCNSVAPAGSGTRGKRGGAGEAGTVLLHAGLELLGG